MPVTGWHAQAIRRLFSGTLPGDWGDEGDPDTGVAVLRSTNFRDDGSIDYGDLAFRSIAAARLEKRGIHRGTILIEKAGGSSTRPAGRVVYCDRDFDGTASNFVEIVRVAQQYVPQYVFYLLYWNYHAGRVHKYQQRTTGIINFKLCEYSDEEVLVPAKTAEQSKIAEVLSTVDRAIKETEALIAKQQHIKTGLMQDLLTRGIDEHGNLRSEQTHEFKDSPLGRIPVEWDIASLGSVAESVTSGSRGWAKYYREEGALFIRIGNLTREHINLRLDDLVFVQPPESAEGLRTAVQAGDLLISVTADLGIIGVIPKGFVEGYVNQHIALARLLPADVSARFVGWFLSSREGRAQFDRLNESGAKAGLNLPTVRSLLFPRPDVDEQHRIAVAIDACVRIADQHACSLQKLRALKRGLMQDLLTGNRRVTALLEQSEGVTT